MFGKRLYEARKKRGLTLEQLASIYNKRFDGGLSKGTLSKYENEKQEPMISTVGNIASILGVSVDYLIDDKENNQNNVELDENVIMYHRDGKTVRKKMSKEQMKMLSSMIDAIPDEEHDF